MVGFTENTGKGAQRYQSAEFRAGRARLTELWERQPHLPRLLSEAGYRTMQTGKWWLGDYTHGGFQEGMTKGGRHGDEGAGLDELDPTPVTAPAAADGVHGLSEDLGLLDLELAAEDLAEPLMERQAEQAVGGRSAEVAIDE